MTGLSAELTAFQVRICLLIEPAGLSTEALANCAIKNTVSPDLEPD